MKLYLMQIKHVHGYGNGTQQFTQVHTTAMSNM